MNDVSASPFTGYSGTLSPFAVGLNLQVSVISAAAVTSHIHLKTHPAVRTTYPTHDPAPAHEYLNPSNHCSHARHYRFSGNDGKETF